MTRRMFPAAWAVSLLLLVATCALWVRSCFVMDRVRHQTRNGWVVGDGHSQDSVFRWSFFTLVSAHGRLGWCSQDVIVNGSGTAGFCDTLAGSPAPARWIYYSSASIPKPLKEFIPPNWWGFGGERRRLTENIGGGTLVMDQVICSMPLWFIALAAAVLPLAWLGREVRNGRHTNPGICPMCGYDLRANKDRCSECGTPIVRPGLGRRVGVQG